jgi:dUTP pyrophosphatase
MENTLKYTKLTPTARFGAKEEDNAGYDLFAPQIQDYSIIIEPQEVVKIFTGIKLVIPKGYWGEIKERGSTGSKGMSVRSGVVDCNYRGEIIVVLNNTTDKRIVHDVNKAVAQIVIQKCEHLDTKEIGWDFFAELTTERGEKGFGSTDKQ